ncbi:MAG: hypothetical protein KAI43_09835 [Candidatus Aureabacteria bacterium]|nr:hypothetical protein [Candidatus Auribacterota bacterium]
MIITINKKIKVGVVFDDVNENIVPKWFIMDRRQYKIDKVNYIWDEKKGKSLIKHFAVSAENNCYELIYNTKELIWFLASVDDEV